MVIAGKVVLGGSRILIWRSPSNVLNVVLAIGGNNLFGVFDIDYAVVLLTILIIVMITLFIIASECWKIYKK